MFIYKYLVYILCRTLADQVDEDQYKDFYYQHHGGAVSYGHQGRGQGSQQYYMTIDQVLYYVNVLSLKFFFPFLGIRLLLHIQKSSNVICNIKF